MKCPNCQHAMNIVEDPVARLEVCPNCGGTWFDEGELSVIDTLIEPTMLEIRKIPNMSG